MRIRRVTAAPANGIPKVSGKERRCTEEYCHRFGYDRIAHIYKLVGFSGWSHNVDIKNCKWSIKNHLEDRIESHQNGTIVSISSS
jgi:hypothetical protein